MMRISRVFMLLVMLVLCTDGHVSYGEDEAADKREFQRIKREMREKKKEIKRADRKARSILSELEKIDRDIQVGISELSEQRKLLQEAETALREVERGNADISRELAGLKRSYGQRLRALYQMNRRGYAAALLTSDGPDGTIKRIKYLRVIAERDRTLMREYGSALERLIARQADISEKKRDILSGKRTIEVKRSQLEAQRQKKAGILAGVREEKGLYEQTLRELEESSTNLWAMIRKDEQARRAARTSAMSTIKPEGALRSDRNRLSWPLEGRVLTRFGMQRHPQFGTMVFRRGIEIEAHEGESVRAVENGQVAYADWYKGYGKLLILDHGSGFYTLYGNLSRLGLSKGDRVDKGQVIGSAGETGSLKGSKLYFEIRRSGEAQDPLTWLAKR